MTNQEKKDLWNAVLAWQSRGYSEKDTVKQLKYLGRASSTIRTYYRAVAEKRAEEKNVQATICQWSQPKISQGS